MDTRDRLLESACDAPNLEAFRAEALAALGDEMDADIGLFATMSEGAVEQTLLGFDEPAATAALLQRWDRYGAEVAPVTAAALQLGAASDLRILGAALYRQRVYREVMAPHGGTESLLIVPALRGQPIGLVMLGKRGGRFSDAALGRARALRAAVAVSCAAAAAKPSGRAPEAGLGTTDRDLLHYLELGYTTKEIAAARGTSYFTVRNQLATLYRRLGVSNRTEAVGLRRCAGRSRN